MKPTILTCAITGNLTKPEQTPHLPISPTQIAEESLAAADAGAASVHLHVRDPKTGAPSMDLDLYAKAVEIIRSHRPELIINLTTGPGGRFVPGEDDPRVAGPGTTLLPPLARIEHVVALRPDICSLDLNTMNSGDQVVINTPKNVAKMAEAIRAAGVMPELECFDSGDLVLARKLIDDGVLDGPGLFSFVLGVSYALPFSPASVAFARSLLPDGAQWTAFAIGRHAFPAVAQSWLLGGHVRVGLEDTIYLERGVLARSNAELVSKARHLIESLGGRLATSKEARAEWKLPATNAR
ncbi:MULTISPECIES: 3-keto-5-aminohexanoate cleavage protein [Pandoraea]|uniref:3-keto-5-aminohexanoate cleavage protein n=1 Tax=Pandoraea TaxID=93217 RepID=UPI001F5CC85B|nr:MULTISPECIES: 3-keto-5-aminohexanoate cleavage protein [Pandoraea]MCI3208608.1 NADPH:quinone reductase [Pandoraea sp. LA3]MDN4586637.1 NADPH:quinone reductase [Pandoraea capi]